MRFNLNIFCSNKRYPIMTIRAIVFDAYETLFDVCSISVLAESLFPQRDGELSALWRDKQIEYTRLRTWCSTYKPFREATQDALVFSCRKLGLDLILEAQNVLMGQYAKLQAFPENLEVLQELQRMGLKLAILSNGNSHMLDSAVEAAGMRGIFSHILSMDAVYKFKTAPEACQLAPDAFGLSAKNILFVSSNCWDVCGVNWFGYTTFRVNRTGEPLEELDVTPDSTGSTMRDLLRYARDQSEESK